jgi:hypothetical protein
MGKNGSREMHHRVCLIVATEIPESVPGKERIAAVILQR